MKSGRGKRQELTTRRAAKRGVESPLPERSDNKRAAYIVAENTEYEMYKQAEVDAAVREQGAVRVDLTQLAPTNSYGSSFMLCGYYLPVAFACKTCGKEEIWTPEQQKWFYEVVKGDPNAGPSRCRPCRVAERRRREEARRVHLEGLERKRWEKDAGD